MKNSIFAVVAALTTVFGGGAMAAPIVIGFDDLAPGTTIAGQYAPLVTFSSLPGGNGFGVPMAFDTNDWTGGDSDLESDLFNPFTNESKDFGTVAIISEDNDASDPDDNATGGTFILNFTGPITFYDLDILDLNSGETLTIQLFGLGGSLLATLTNEGLTVADRQFMTISAGDGGIGGVYEMRVALSGSGAIDNIRVEVVPIPGALPLMITGLAGVYAARRRQRKAAA